MSKVIYLVTDFKAPLYDHRQEEIAFIACSGVPQQHKMVTGLGHNISNDGPPNSNHLFKG